MSTPPSVRRRLATMAATGLTAAALLALPAGTAAAEPGKIRGSEVRGAIADSYLVVLEKGAVERTSARPLVDRLATKHRARVKFRYGSALRGFSARMTRAEALRLSLDPAVAYVEQDRRVEAVATQRPTPSWGMDRIDQRSLPLNDAYTYPNSGTGVTAYVIDSGIRTTHTDFGGRAVWGVNTVDSLDIDCNGHGTHVAGTVGGTAYGVAKRVRLVAVKVLDCLGDGSLSSVIAGLDWVTAHHGSGPAVANLSLGAPGSSPALEQAVRDSIADGIVYAVASGNSSSDACGYSPARTAEAITVNASTDTDARASFSNYGSCTDVFAPGQSINSAWYTSDTATATLSGTSMAAPHVAGVAAMVLGARPAATPAQVWTAVAAKVTRNVITDARPGSPNRLLHAGVGPSPRACALRTNGKDVPIRDLRTVSSRITVSGCSGKASATAKIRVSIRHTARGNLVVDLVTPKGAVVKLHNRKGGSANNLFVTYTRKLSGHTANGVWKLRVRDAAKKNTGRIDKWTLDL